MDPLVLRSFILPSKTLVMGWNFSIKGVTNGSNFKVSPFLNNFASL